MRWIRRICLIIRRLWGGSRDVRVCRFEVDWRDWTGFWIFSGGQGVGD
jgi:hypothetical protein